MFNSRGRDQTDSFLPRVPFGVRWSARKGAERKSSSGGKLPGSRQTVSPLNLKYRFQSVVVAGVTCFTFVASMPMALSQEVRGEAAAEEQIYLAQATSEDTSAPEVLTTKDVEIPLDELKLLLKPLTLAQLQVEAAAWQGLLQAKVQEISDAEIAIKRKNRLVEKEEEAIKALEEAQGKLEEAEELKKKATKGSSEFEEASKKVEEAKEALEKAQVAVQEATDAKEKIEGDESIKKAVEAAKEGAEGESEGAEKEEEEVENEEAEAATDELGEFSETEEVEEPEEPEEPDAAEEAAENLEDAAAGLDGGEGSDRAPTAEEVREKKEQLEEAAQKLEESKEEEAELKTQLVVSVTKLQEERIAIVDRFETVLEELKNKGGEAESYEKYIQAISGIDLDITDTEGVGVRLVGWATSEEGGLRWGFNIAKFVVIVIASIIIARTLAKYIDRLMVRFNTSDLMRNFLVNLVNRGGSVIGILLGLTALEVSLGPVLTVLGGASFVLAFALQSNLGNLASGLMIMFYKPFDVGDEVKLGGIWGWVHSINLASTKVKGFSRQMITIPNNTVWGGTIENLTGDETRKGSITIRIGLDDDHNKAEKIILETAKSHPLVLEKPGPSTFLWDYGDSFMPIYFGFTSKTEDFWTVWDDLVHSIKEGLEEAGISLVPVQYLKELDLNDSVPVPSYSNGNPRIDSNINNNPVIDSVDGIEVPAGLDADVPDM
ncbi:MAG: mechanosensitive ion channel [Oscillatoria sp. SIO1A7]|nr:mechanosensitive ion channel [Oscillatoria sp. SIO1A7]